MPMSRLEGKWMSTEELRLFQPLNPPANFPTYGPVVLQRRWVNLDTGADEWRPIPVVIETEETPINA